MTNNPSDRMCSLSSLLPACECGCGVRGRVGCECGGCVVGVWWVCGCGVYPGDVGCINGHGCVT